jgi:DNA-directed RNA polymerase subunit RPC12/RpoP
MYKCEICGKEFNTISNHLITHSITVNEYYDKYVKSSTEGFCIVCGNPTKFISFRDGYGKHCSCGCVSRDPNIQKKKTENNVKKYGVKYTSQLKENREKYKETCQQRYGTNNPSSLESVKKKRIDNSREKYGTDYPNQSQEVKDKYKETCNHKYGCTHYSMTEEFKQKCKEAWLEIHGVDNPMKVPSIVEIIRKKEYEKTYHKILSGERTNFQLIPLFTFSSFRGVSNRIEYPWFCLKCSTKFEDHIDDGHIPRCPTCYPPLQGFSKMEKELVEFVKSLNVEVLENVTNILSNNRELDLYIPSHNVAIEFDGLYWHSEVQGHKDQFYHLKKTEECEAKGIRLLHIFEDEWINKPSIVKSLIRSKLGLSDHKLFARKCEVARISFKDAREFLNENHIQGCGTPSKICYGLAQDFRIVAVMTLAKPRYNKKYDYELVRYATLKNYSIVGGFSKLLKAFTDEHNPNYIISYADRRYSAGGVYEKCNFKPIEDSKPNYFYIEPDMKRSSRVKYQKHKLGQVLKTFDEKLTEWQNMQLNGFDRIWDCGNLVYLYEPTNQHATEQTANISEG